MRKVICLFAAVFLLLCGCTNEPQEPQAPQEPTERPEGVFTKNERGNLVSDSGVEYAFFAVEWDEYCYLGELEHVAGVEGEDGMSSHMGYPYQTGMFRIKGSDNENILIRHAPENEWYAIYRKAEIPNSTYSTENCIRLEYVPMSARMNNDNTHVLCGDGLTDPAEIAAFFSQILAQEHPRDAGLYDMIEKPDGFLENCYTCGVIYGFFPDEPNLVICIKVTSFNDLAYSVMYGNDEYVLPDEWFQKLLNP